MQSANKHTRLLLFSGSILVVCLFLVNIAVGSVHIPIEELLGGLLGNPMSKLSWATILFEYRIPKAITALLVGTSLALSGLQMQTFFRNPLAGPYVLGISSGAGLGVAILILGGSAFGWSLTGNAGNYLTWGVWGVIISGSLGAITVLLLMSLTAWKIKDSMSLLIIGLMFGSASGAVVSVLSYFGNAEDLKLFTIWTMGSLGGISGSQLYILSLVCLTGIIPVLLMVKSYNAMLMGERYATSMGINIKSLRWTMIISTGILAGSATAFCGPIAFVGIAVPHLARMVFRTGDHKILFPASALIGAAFLLASDAISQLPGSAETLPINVITSLFGAPLVIWLILKRNFSSEF
ncbi:iron ABC transporter permease [Echinicola marina]|uniref:iron ABC transporter permease n=1 Tax=Echinicola marina TaxID=2859768 RepID=UPI001CF664D6|nr:iron ABC transporter permease [Echinicola marina]UCS93458.1 iron ABC transporter permease [Echinicola marina]